MPVWTKMERDGETLSMPFGWGGWHLQVLVEAIETEGYEGGWFMYWPTNSEVASRYVFSQEHKFEDPSDGEVLHIMPGDVYSYGR